MRWIMTRRRQPVPLWNQFIVRNLCTFFFLVGALHVSLIDYRPVPKSAGPSWHVPSTCLTLNFCIKIHTSPTPTPTSLPSDSAIKGEGRLSISSVSHPCDPDWRWSIFSGSWDQLTLGPSSTSSILDFSSSNATSLHITAVNWDLFSVVVSSNQSKSFNWLWNMLHSYRQTYSETSQLKLPWLQAQLTHTSRYYQIDIEFSKSLSCKTGCFWMLLLLFKMVSLSILLVNNGIEHRCLRLSALET